MFGHEGFDGHEAVTAFNDERSGLRGFVAIHSTALGPAMGGCRVWQYADAGAALTDVLRLSRGMSYKNAIAGLPRGGGKAVIMREPTTPMNEAMFEAFGDVVERLGGRYVTAEDVGVSEHDMVSVARRTRYVGGLPRNGVSGDPSPKTALGVFLGIRAAVKARLGKRELTGLTVAVQGLGNVGRHLCTLLHRAGAKLIVADLNPAVVNSICERLGAVAVDVDSILSQKADVFAPCALGGVLTADTIARLCVPIVAGAANNQLRSDEDGRRLFDAGILYAPDYVINAGGIIACGQGYLQPGDDALVDDRVAGIERSLTELFERSASERVPTNLIADALARERLGLPAKSALRRAA